MGAYDNEARELLCRGHSYVYAAHLLVADRGNKRLLRAPILHLIAHGLETVTKSVLVQLGSCPTAVRKKYGHDLASLWEASEMSAFRERAKTYAQRAWCDAQAKQRNDDCYPEEDFSGDPESLLEEHIRALSDLHTKASGYALRYIAKASGYALRYIAPPDQSAPLPLLLVDTFYPMFEDLVRERGP